MCGILVVVDKCRSNNEDPGYESHLSTLTNRGPDGFGSLKIGHVWMGHTRLAIIDLSPEAEQPFSDTINNNTISFNGEIYNHTELRARLTEKGYKFRTKSDTEVILGVYAAYGSEGFSILRGMYAFVIYDQVNKKIVIARDRFGEKPLYINHSKERIVISSQIETIHQLNDSDEIQISSALNYLHYQYVGPHQTILQNVKRFKPNTIEEYNLDGILIQSQLIHKENRIFSKPSQKNLVNFLEEAVSRNLVADVPVCIAQSGGVDSVAIAILASKLSRNEIHSFTIGYSGKFNFDERPWAAKLSAMLGNIQHDIEISETEFINDFDEYVSALQDPIADPAGYAQFRLAREVHRNGFKVCLTGLGADELFWGYPWVVNALAKNGFFLENSESKPETLGCFRRLESFGYKLYRNRLDLFRELPQKVDKNNLYFYSGINEFNSAFSLSQEYLNISSLDKFDAFGMSGQRMQKSSDIPRQLQETLFQTWLSCNSLSLIDQVSMYNSVEFRSPYLDSDLADFALMLTDSNLGATLYKGILKEELSQFLPEEFLIRPKSGFNFPSNIWFRTLLKERGDSLLNGILSSNNLLNRKKIEKALTKIDRLSWQNIFFLYKILLLDTYLKKFGKDE
jgi:asparagine synthase (glutamine-hydrolysing)